MQQKLMRQKVMSSAVYFTDVLIWCIWECIDHSPFTLVLCLPSVVMYICSVIVQSFPVFPVSQSTCLSECVHVSRCVSVCMLTVCMLAISTRWNGECVTREKKQANQKLAKLKKNQICFNQWLKLSRFWHLAVPLFSPAAHLFDTAPSSF